MYGYSGRIAAIFTYYCFNIVHRSNRSTDFEFDDSNGMVRHEDMPFEVEITISFMGILPSSKVPKISFDWLVAPCNRKNEC